MATTRRRRRGLALAILLCVGLLAVAIALPAPSAAGGDAIAEATGSNDSASAATAVGTATAAQDDPVDVEIEQTARGNLFLTNETPSVVLDADGADLAWTLRDHDGRIVASGEATVDGETTVELPVDSIGHYTFRVRSATKPTSQGSPPGTLARTTVAVLPADEFDHDDVFFAMSTKFGAGRDHAMMETLELAGVAAVRDEHGWQGVEQTRGEYDFSGAHRRGFMQKLDEEGFDRLFLSVYGNPLYAEDEHWEGTFTFPYDEEYRAGYANYTRAAVREYPDLQHVEVWNEPNIESFSVGPAGQDPSAYAKLLAATDEAVDAERSGVTIVGGSTTRNHSGTNQVPPGIDYQYWEGVYEAGGAEHVDAAALHLYRRQPDEFAEDLERYHELTREYNDGETVPVWVTELGWPTAPHFPGGDGESMQAQHLVQSHARLQAAGVERYYWYTQVDTFYEDNVWQVDDGNNQFGLLRGPESPLGAYAPKPGYPAYATMTRQLADAEFQRERPNPVQQYVFDGRNGPVRVLWAEERQEVTIETDEPVTVTTMTGSEQSLQPVDGEVYLTVGPDPVYLGGKIDGIEAGAPVELEGVITSGGESGDDSSGDGSGGSAGARVRAEYTNEGASDRTVEHRIGEASVSGTVASGDTDSASIDVASAYGDRAGVAVDVVHVDGQPVARLEAPVGVPRAHFGEPAFVSGMTVETANEGRHTGFSEVDDVGTDHSAFEATDRAGVACYRTGVDAGERGQTLYVDVSDDHAGQLGDTVPVTVRYFDDGDGTFGIEYVDGSGSGAATQPVELDGDGEWETHTFELDGAAFPTASGDIVANGGHDLEVTLKGSFVGRSDGDVCFESVTLGTEPTTAIDPETDGETDGGDGDGETNGTANDGGDGESEGTDGGDGDGLPGFGIGTAVVAILAASLLATARLARRRPE